MFKEDLIFFRSMVQANIDTFKIDPQTLTRLAESDQLAEVFSSPNDFMDYIHSHYVSAVSPGSKSFHSVMILVGYALCWHYKTICQTSEAPYVDLSSQLKLLASSGSDTAFDHAKTRLPSLIKQLASMSFDVSPLNHTEEIIKKCDEVVVYQRYKSAITLLSNASSADDLLSVLREKGFDFNYRFFVNGAQVSLVEKLSETIYRLSTASSSLRNVPILKSVWYQLLSLVIENTVPEMLVLKNGIPALFYIAATLQYHEFELAEALYKKIPNEINAIYKGYTALDIALELKNKQMVTWLLTHGGHLADGKRWQSISNEFYATTTAYQKFVALYELLKWRLDKDSLPVELYGIVIKQMYTLDDQSPLGKALACTGPAKTLEIGLALNEYNDTVGTNGHIELFRFCMALARRLHRFDLLQPLFKFGNRVPLSDSDRQRYQRQWYDELFSTLEFDLVFAGFLILNDLDIRTLDKWAENTSLHFTEKFTPDMDITVLKCLAHVVIAMRSQQWGFSFPFFTERTPHVEILKKCLLENTIKRPAVFLAIKNALSGCTKEGTAWAVLKGKMESLYFQSLFSWLHEEKLFLNSAQAMWERFTALSIDERMQLLPYLCSNKQFADLWLTNLKDNIDNVEVLKFWGYVFACMAPGKDAKARVEVRTLNALLALPSPEHRTLALAMIGVFDAYSKKSPFIDVGSSSDEEGCRAVYLLLSQKYNRTVSRMQRVTEGSSAQIERLKIAIKNNVPELILLAMADPMFDLKSVFITGTCFDGKKKVNHYSLLAIAALALGVSEWWQTSWTDVLDGVLAHPDLGTIINAQEGGEKATVLDMVVIRGQAALAITLVDKGARFSTDNTLTPSVLRSVVDHPFIGDDTRVMFIQMIIAQHNEVAVKELCQIMRARYKTRDLSLAEQPWETQIRVYLQTKYLRIWENSERSVPIIQEIEIELPDLYPETHKSNEQKAPVVSVVSEGNGETKPAPSIVKFSEDYLTPQQRKAQEEQQERLNCIKTLREARLSEPEKKDNSMELT